MNITWFGNVRKSIKHIQYTGLLWLVFILLQFTGPDQVFAQVPFQRTIGLDQHESVYSFVPISDGYLIAGVTRSAGQSDILLVKTDFNFNFNWGKTIGGSQNEIPYAIIACADGGNLIIGRTNSFGQGGEDVMVIKLTAAHDLEWTKTYGLAGDDRGYCVIETGDGYLLGGKATTSGEVGMIIKIDLSGNVVWSKTYGDVNYSGWFFDVLETGNGNYIFEGPFEYPGQSSNYSLTEVSPLGDVLMAKTYNADGEDESMDVLAVPGDGYYILGHSNSFSSVGSDLYLLKTDLNGNVLWAKSYESNEDLWAAQVFLTSTNELLLSCHSDLLDKDILNNDIVLISCDLAGNMNWAKSYGGTGSESQHLGVHETIFEVHPDLYTLIGQTSSFGEGQEDIYIIGIDRDGVSACNQFQYDINVTNQPGTDENVTMTVQNYNLQVAIHSMSISQVEMVDSLLCPIMQPPLAMFSVSDTSICQGGCVEFTDHSLQDPDHWEWHFDGAVPTTSTGQFPPNICYADTGCFDVLLVVSNDGGIDSLLMLNYVCVYRRTGIVDR